MEQRRPEQGEVWGKILFFSGLVSVIIGIVLWLLTSVFVAPESDDFISAIAVYGLCCFGPPALLGAFLCIIGIILWTSYRRRS
jgi:hypothetical protein